MRGLNLRNFAFRGIGVLVALALAAVAGAQQASAASAGLTRAGDYPGTSTFALASPVRDGAQHSAAGTFPRAATWGGVYTTSSGNRITMRASSWFRGDNQWLQGWANWLDAYLPHGSEFNRLTVMFVPERNSYYDDLGSACGPGAAGCYFPDQQLLIAPGNHLSYGVRMESVLAHEYGHHVANNRSNSPWNAGDYGPKRWATRMNICGRAAAGTAFPGDEGAHYKLNPGEAWAETYRQMVWSSHTWTSWPQEPWDVVDQSFYPDSTALFYARQDVTEPWSADQETMRTFTGKLTKKRRSATVSFATLNDGDVSVQLFSPSGARLTLADGISGEILDTATASFSHTSCGERLLRIRISGPAGKRYRIVVHTP